MPTTANGTAYTVRSVELPGHGTCYWAVANAVAGQQQLPAVLYAHGAGGAADQFASLGAWRGLRDWIIDHGVVWIEGTGGGSAGAQNWGNPGSRAAYLAYLDHVGTVLSIGLTALLGRSMGALVTAWLYAKSGRSFAGWINNSGVSTWLTAESGTATIDYFTPSVTRAAWGVTNRADHVSAIQAADAAPEAWAPEVWDGKRILSLYGDADSTVPWTPRGAGVLRSIWAGRPALDLVDHRVGGDHSATNGSYLQVAAMADFLSVVLDLDSPVPSPEVLRNRGSYVLVGTRRHRITRR